MENGNGMQPLPLTGMTALVTGGARGLGEAIARRLAADGARLLLADLDGQGAEAVAASLPAPKDTPALSRALDISVDGAPAEALLWTETEAGAVDILVNNAGIGVMGAFLEMPISEVRRTMDINLIGSFAMTQAFAKPMVERGFGRVISITSISAHRGGISRAAYGGSKAGLELMMRVLALELGDSGVTANCVAPGPVDTELTRKAYDTHMRQNYAQLIPQRRFADPSEVAAAVAFLARRDSAYITGQVITVDGGYDAAGVGVIQRPAERS